MKSITIYILFAFIPTLSFSQKDQLEKVWLNQEKTSKIFLYKSSDNKFYGKIVWLKITNDENGIPRVDKNNPVSHLKKTPLINLIILRAFEKTDDPNVYENGTIYDPNNGKTYCGKITFKGKELALRGHLCSFSILGRTSTWTLAE